MAKLQSLFGCRLPSFQLCSEDQPLFRLKQGNLALVAACMCCDLLDFGQALGSLTRPKGDLVKKEGCSSLKLDSWSQPVIKCLLVFERFLASILPLLQVSCFFFD